MPIFFSVAVDRTPGPELAINCPICKRQDALASSYQEAETVMLFWVMPIMRHRNSIVVCSGCGAKLYSRLNIDKFHESTPEQIDRSLYPQGGMLVLTLFLISLMIFCIPIVNLVPAIFVPIANRHASKKNRIIGYIPLAIALAFNVFIIVTFVVDYLRGGP